MKTLRDSHVTIHNLLGRPLQLNQPKRDTSRFMGASVALCVLALMLFAPQDLSAQNRIETSALQERDRKLLKSNTLTMRGQAVVVLRRRDTAAGNFILRGRGGGPLKVTFNECNNAAKETCGSGVQDVSYDDHGDDKPNTGDCSYSCFAAAGSGD